MHTSIRCCLRLMLRFVSLKISWILSSSKERPIIRTMKLHVELVSILKKNIR